MLPRTNCRRVARRSTTWELPKRFPGYAVKDSSWKAIGGVASKCFIVNEADENDFYIAKAPGSFGTLETLTELLINQLGSRLGFRMAHSGIARVGGILHFVTKNFRAPDQVLAHGITMFCREFGVDVNEMATIPKVRGEQSFYTADMVESVMRAYCGGDFDRVFPAFLEMLTFDAAVGSMDRHAENWGVLGSSAEPAHFELAPIYDSARALLWNCAEHSLQRYGSLTSHHGPAGTHFVLQLRDHPLTAYINRSRPLIGIEGAPTQVNHFELLRHLRDRHGALMEPGLRKVRPDAIAAATEILDEYPFDRTFSLLRRRLIRAILHQRARTLIDPIS